MAIRINRGLVVVRLAGVASRQLPSSLASKEELPRKPSLALSPLAVPLLKYLEIEVHVGALFDRYIETLQILIRERRANRAKTPRNQTSQDHEAGDQGVAHSVRPAVKRPRGLTAIIASYP